MAVDAARILAVSRGKYSVGSATTDAITSETLTLFKSWAVEEIALDFPTGSLSTTQAELAEALLVLHYIELDSSDKTSESISGYAYSRKDGTTPWLNEYRRLVQTIAVRASKAARYARSGTDRSDKDLGDLAYDQTTLTIGGTE